MALKVIKVEVWAGEIQDQPGGLAEVLRPAVAAGANFEFMIARRQPDKPGTGVVFVTPVRGGKVREAARAGGLSMAKDIATLKIEGPDRPGLIQQINQTLGDAGVSMRRLSASASGRKFTCFIGFDTPEAADVAAKVIRSLGRKQRTVGDGSCARLQARVAVPAAGCPLHRKAGVFSSMNPTETCGHVFLPS